MGEAIKDVSERAELERWLGGNGVPAGSRPLIMFLRGSGEAVSGFAPMALKRIVQMPDRELVWVKNAALFTEAEQRTLFKDRSDMLAVVFDRNGAAAGWVDRSNASISSAERAFLAAMEVE